MYSAREIAEMLKNESFEKFEPGDKYKRKYLGGIKVSRNWIDFRGYLYPRALIGMMRLRRTFSELTKDGFTFKQMREQWDKEMELENATGKKRK